MAIIDVSLNQKGELEMTNNGNAKVSSNATIIWKVEKKIIKSIKIEVKGTPSIWKKEPAPKTGSINWQGKVKKNNSDDEVSQYYEITATPEDDALDSPSATPRISINPKNGFDDAD